MKLTQKVQRRRMSEVTTLGEVLKAWRDANDLTQEAAAAKCEGLTRPEWGMIEQGRRWRLRDDTFACISSGTGIDEARLREAALEQKLRNVEGELQAASGRRRLVATAT